MTLWRQKKKISPLVWRLPASMALVFGLVAAGQALHLTATEAGFLLILVILLIAMHCSRVESLAALVIAAPGFSLFVPPYGQFNLNTVEGWVAVVAFLITTVSVSHLSSRARSRETEAIARRKETERLYELGQALLGSDRFETVAWTVINKMVPIFGIRSAAFWFRSTGEVHRAGSESCVIPLEELEKCGKTGLFLSKAEALISVTPILLDGEVFGCLGTCGDQLSETVLKSVAHLVTVMLERLRATEDLAKVNVELARQNEEVTNQRQRSESLLLNILPAEVADELRTKGIVAPKYYEDVTIIFTDFVGFTLSTEQLAAEDLVRMLHEYFTAFDQICARYHLEKMKTIGDAYMCIGGLPARNPAHPVDAVMAAFEMVEEVIRRDSPENLVHWKVRIGLHTGPVIAGVVGINKFAFDIWGDTVNFSSRMESSGEPNRVNISERTYSRVKDFIECEHRGKVLTKEKREFDMYFAKGILPRLVDGSGMVPPPAFTRRYNVYFQKDPPSFPAFLLDAEAESRILAPL